MPESRKWMSKAFNPKHKGLFKAKAGRAGESTAEFAKEHEHSPGKLGKQARLAEMGAHHGQKKRNWYGK